MGKRLEIVAPAAASLGGLLVGCGISWSSPAIPRMPFPVTPQEISWIVSIRFIGSLMFALVAGHLANQIGRKPSLVLSGAPGLLSWLIIAFTRTVPSVLIARFLVGIATSIFSCVTPIYIGEVADKRYRGWMIALMSLMINLGQLFEYSVGPFVSYTMLAVLSAIFPAVFILIMMFMPESPMFYIMNDRLDSAQTALSELRGGSRDQIQTELRKTVSHVVREKTEKCNIMHLILHRGPRKALLIVMGLLTVQHLSGLMALLMYAEEIFQKAKDPVIPSQYSPILLSVFQTLATITCALFTDRAGRRPLLMISTTGCGIFLILAGMSTFLDAIKVSFYYAEWLPIIGIIGYFIMFNVGIGPIPFVVEGELFPPNMKGLALSLCSVYVGILDFLVTKTFPHLQDLWGQFVLFWIYAGISFLGTLFVFFFVPETKGKAIADIVNEMKGSSYQLSQTPQKKPSEGSSEIPDTNKQEQGQETK